MNEYKGDFSDADKKYLDSFDGFTFWMVASRYSKTGFEIYAKHESWGESQRTRADDAFGMYMSLNIARNSGGY